MPRAPRLNSSILSPLVVGLAIWVGFPSQGAYQDVSTLVVGGERGSARWHAVVETSVAGSVHEAELPFSADPALGQSVSGAGLRTGGLGDVAFRGKGAQPKTPDEARINRAEKRGRLMRVAPVAPPKSFSAGSIFEHTSLMLRPSLEAGPTMAFAKPKSAAAEIRIASAFHPKREKTVHPAVPVLLADLVNNDRPDVLATAYAPPKPDYARTSPFASLLKGSKEPAVRGRFIPPLAPGDHAWASRPLPAGVFGRKEQRCLAEGIYFEARGEPVKGQAAVAQVILNRVRAPSYPGTICGVVYQNVRWRNRCQFSFACDGIRDRIASPRHWKIARDVAMAVTAGKIWLDEVGTSTHYHATYVRPRWARTMKRMNRIGQHIFYRTFGGGWS